jgi:ABC-type glycerol-3-phosphate transport system substrate-binding protein
MKKTLAVLILATLASPLLAAGPLGSMTSLAKTNNVTFTYTGTEPAYIEAIDIRCSTVNTATVNVVNYSQITNAVIPATESTNGIVAYLPDEPNRRVIKGGTVTITFTGLTTNSVAVELVQK